MRRYYPLLLVLFYVLLATAIVVAQTPDASWHFAMRIFMGGFFFAFSFFKLLNLQGFVKAYVAYDLIARQVKPYAYAYPFIELGLGILYLVGAYPTFTHWATLVVMTLSAAGVLRSLRRGDNLKCACLGTFFDLPMSTVTLAEDLVMAVMALVMLCLPG